MNHMKDRVSSHACDIAAQSRVGQQA